MGQAERPVLVLGKVRRILDSFSLQRPAQSLLEISKATGLPMTTTLRLLRSLVNEGFLVKQGEQYLLGYALLRWGSIAVRSRDLVTVATPVMEALRDSTEETVCLYVRNDLNRVCVAVASSRRPIAQQSNVGEVFPLQAGSINKVFLAYAPAVREQVLRNGLVRFTDNTITDPVEFRVELERVHARGYAMSQGEAKPGVATVSCPILNQDGSILAVITVGGPTQRATPEVLAQLLPQLAPAAAEISQQLGWLGAAA
jgi:IclR family acetate operon transcriptional repressor